MPSGLSASTTALATAAVSNAVVDALGGLGIRHLDMPYTSQKVWSAIQSAKGGQA